MSPTSRTRGTLVSACVVAAGALTACGGVTEAEKTRSPRPPATVDLTATISGDGVLVSPRAVGAGPVRILVTNQTDAPQRPRLRRSGGRVLPAASIPAGGVATLRTTLTRGRWTLRGAGDGATIRVGPRRPSADSDLLLP